MEFLKTNPKATWEMQFDKVLSSCKYAEIVKGVRIAIAKQYLQRALYSTITTLGIDLKRSLEGGYLIRAYDKESESIKYIEIEIKDLEKYVRDIAYITGLQYYELSHDTIEFVLHRIFKRKEII